jgi:hypothetical protein
METPEREEQAPEQSDDTSTEDLDQEPDYAGDDDAPGSDLQGG